MGQLRTLGLVATFVMGALAGAVAEGIVVTSSVDRLRVRSGPTLEAPILYHLSDGEEALAIGMTREAVEIGDQTGHWYQIVLITGEIGWTFGGFLRDAPGYSAREMTAETEVRELGDDLTVVDIVGEISDSYPPIGGTIIFQRSSEIPALIVAARVSYQYEDWYKSTRLQTIDLVADAREELVVVSTEGTSEGSDSDATLFALHSDTVRYQQIGRWPVHSWERGDHTYLDLVEGPQGMMRDGERLIVLLYESVELFTEPVVEYRIRVWEEFYALRGERLVMIDSIERAGDGE